MKFSIRPWRYGKVALFTEQGHVLACFSSLSRALTACEQWYLVDRGKTEKAADTARGRQSPTTADRHSAPGETPDTP